MCTLNHLKAEPRPLSKKYKNKKKIVLYVYEYICVFLYITPFFAYFWPSSKILIATIDSFNGLLLASINLIWSQWYGTIIGQYGIQSRGNYI